ncbi:hypothetical protein SGPA1_12714 [Streptomyces misionensis JCM 4497]
MAAGARSRSHRRPAQALSRRRQAGLRLRPAPGRGLRLRRRGHRLQDRLDPRQPPGAARRHEARLRAAQGEQDPVRASTGPACRCPQGAHEGVPASRGHPALGQAGRRAEDLPSPLRRREGAGVQPQRLQHGRLEARPGRRRRDPSPRARCEVPPGGPGGRDARPPARLRLRAPRRGGEHQGALRVPRPLGPGLHAADVHASAAVQRDADPQGDRRRLHGGVCRRSPGHISAPGETNVPSMCPGRLKAPSGT